MILFFAAVAIWVFSGAFSAALGRYSSIAGTIGTAGAVLGGALGVGCAAGVLITGNTSAIELPWSIPYASFSLQIDPLSAFFLLLICAAGMITALYGREYLRHYEGGASHTWIFFNTMLASMAVVVTASNAILFLMAWELMALSSFFLVILESEKDSVRRAGTVYLIATQVGTAFLLIFFLMLGNQAQSLDFAKFAVMNAGPTTTVMNAGPAHAGVLFLMAVLGFGSKAGFVPLHVWLPEAHPAAPSHVSALMSGVMIKTGIYGLLRALTFLGVAQEWWGWALIAIGFVSAVWGILCATSQNDLKRLLAYSSIENVGIIVLGLGLALVGQTRQQPVLATLGAIAALFHVANHAAYKSLLFLGAGGVLHATGSLSLNGLGGLLKKTPWFGAAFLIGSLAICGLPPLNGIASEFLMYLGVLQGGFTARSAAMMPLALALLALILVGGFSVVSFAKAFGSVFLGSRRNSADAGPVHAPGFCMQASVVFLAAVCIVLSFAAPLVALGIGRLLGKHGPFVADVSKADLAGILKPLVWLSIVNAVTVVALAVVAVVRRRILKGRKVGAAVTWDCGYSFPSARMQYTASSFAQPVTLAFKSFLKTDERNPRLGSYFPHQAEYSSETPDLFLERIFTWIFRRCGDLAWRFHKIQYGRVQIYILYILVTLITLLVWYIGVAQ